MTIFYFPNPSTQPAPATVAGDSYFGVNDAYITQNGAVRIGNLGSGLSAGKITLVNYDLTKPFLGVTGGTFPGLSSPPIPPAITASTLVGSQTVTQGSAIHFTPVTAYGGAGIANGGYSVSISPALPPGLNLKLGKTRVNVQGAAPTIT